MINYWFIVFYSFLFPVSHADSLPDSNQPVVKVSFVDDCTLNETRVATPNGTTLKVEIDNFVGPHDINVTISYSLSGAESASFISSYALTREKVGRTQIYYFDLPKDRRMNSVESTNEGSTVWDVSVEWTQGIYSGVAVASLLRSDDPLSFYRQIDPNSCNWESGPMLSSQYYFNADQPQMSIARETVLRDEIGLSFGEGPDFQREPDGIALPPTVPMTAFYFKERYNQSSMHHTVSLERTWYLSQGQGGVFADRYSFNRMQVEHYEWTQPRKGCGVYRKTEEGTMDIGTVTTDFYSVPPSFSGDAEKMVDFINRMRPSINTCTGVNSIAPSPMLTDVSTNRDLLYFQPNVKTVNPLNQ